MPITYRKLKTEYEITDGKYKILCDIENDKISVYTPQGKNFTFISSTPEIVDAIGKLISYASEIIAREEE
ncbi:MAG TPA: hypothetical protein DHV62_06780 [Elusimicrobia bacterium]|nr:hypothetical protein [Elusimicrobiota bacterium]